MLITFGLEGNTLRNSLSTCGYCRAGLAMFPEIVGPTCVEAAIRALDGQPLPPHLVTPTAILTPESLSEFYERSGNGWDCNWKAVEARLKLPLPLNGEHPARGKRRSLGASAWSCHSANTNGTPTLRSACAHMPHVTGWNSKSSTPRHRARKISRCASVRSRGWRRPWSRPGDVVLIDAGPVTTFLAEALADRQGITVITNSLGAIEALRDRPGVTLIVTGGLLPTGSDALSGPTAEQSFRELRADKLFLSAVGVTPEFGISHDRLAEVATKQAMVRVAREIILLADHTLFGQESVTQVAPLRVLSRVITDNALPATTRLELSKTGIEVIIART